MLASISSVRGGAAAPFTLPALPRAQRQLTALSVAHVVQGLLLDLDAATLTVWIHGERKGVMTGPPRHDGL